MFNLEKNQKREKTLLPKAKAMVQIGMKVKGGSLYFSYAGQTLVASFAVLKHPFAEVYNGKAKERKGFVVCTVYEPGSFSALARGYSVCSDKDEWSDNKGCLEAFVDAVGSLSYKDRKKTIDDNWRAILNDAHKYLKEA